MAYKEGYWMAEKHIWEGVLTKGITTDAIEAEDGDVIIMPGDLSTESGIPYGSKIRLTVEVLG